VANLEAFQKMLGQHQERLEGMARGPSNPNTSANGIAPRRY
jgi:hypothetical protein